MRDPARVFSLFVRKAMPDPKPLTCSALVFVIVLAAAGSASVPRNEAGRPAWTVTYVANEGFLIATPGGKILCDALFGGITGDWCDQPSAETVEMLKGATGPFAGVGVVTVSHAHADHFDPHILVAHILHNPGVRVFCPNQARAVLERDPAWERIKTNVFAVTPDQGRDETFEAGPIRVRVLRVDHGPYLEDDPTTKERVNRHRNVENLAFVLEAGEMRMIHAGDASPASSGSLRGYLAGDERLDLAFLDRAFCAAAGREIVERDIRPDVLVYMHIRPGDAPKFQGCVDASRAGAPELVLFEKPGDVRMFPIKERPGFVASPFLCSPGTF